MQINSLLRTRLKEKTVIVISHRESVLKGMNQIILMDAGRIVQVDDYEIMTKSDVLMELLMKYRLCF